MLALNTGVSETTGYSPAFITQGTGPRLPNTLFDEVTIGTGTERLQPKLYEQEIREVFKIVKRNLATASENQKRYYNLRRRWKPNVGDLVLVKQHSLSKATDNFAAKLAPKFGGLYIVKSFISSVIVNVQNINNNQKRNVHLSEIKPYIS